MLQGIIMWLALFPFAWALVMIPICVIGVTYGMIKEGIHARKQRQLEYKFARYMERLGQLRHDAMRTHTKFTPRWTMPSEDQ